MVVVSDAGPIIAFARAKHEDILRQLFEIILIPDAVYEETVSVELTSASAVLVQASPWIQRVDIQRHTEIDTLPAPLGAGEREAILLAEERKMPLLLDDLAARKEAEKRGLIYFGSLRVLQDAKKQGILISVKPVLDTMIQSGLWLGDDLYAHFLNIIGE
jgi:predicted nucleic acid-binding protein